MGYIIDLSHHQVPSKIDYDKLAKQLDFAIIRTQYGSRTVDRHYKTHHTELRKRGVPTAAYAWVRGINYGDMQVEAENFYNRTIDFNPTFWFLDVEEESMKDMRYGIKAYVKRLRELGAKKVGVYIAHHLYKKFNLDMSDFDAVWIPRYGVNNGKPDKKPDFKCDLWQYTDKGRLDGYPGYLDLNKIISDKPLSHFTGATKVSKPKKEQPKKTGKTFKVVTTLNGYKTAADAKNRRNKAGTVKPGTYYVFNESQCMINVTNKQGVPGSWINPADNKKAANKKTSNNSNVTTYTVKKGDTLWGISQKYGMTVAELKKLNGLVSDVIIPGQVLKVRTSGTTIKVGSKVKVKKTASKYATGQNIPNWVKGNIYTVQRVKSDQVLLKEIVSWVYKKDVTLI